MVDTCIPLGTLRRGQSAFISSVLGQMDHVQRLGEIGLRDGCRLEMLRPGSPCIIRVGGSTLCLRCDERLQVLVVPAAEQAVSVAEGAA